MSPQIALLAFTAGLVVAVVTAPVGVSGAVFLLPVQLDVLRVPSPVVTPTNLIFNVVSTPGALLRYRHSGSPAGPLTRRLLTGTLPGVVIGTAVRVHLAPGDRIFRVLAAAVLLPLGVWLCTRRRDRPPRPHPLRPRTITAMGLGVGVVGGIYGIGGGSLLGPLLVGAGLSVAAVAPGGTGRHLPHLGRRCRRLRTPLTDHRRAGRSGLGDRAPLRARRTDRRVRRRPGPATRSGDWAAHPARLTRHRAGDHLRHQGRRRVT